MSRAKDKTQKISMRIATSKLELLMKQYKTGNITEIFNKLIDEKLSNQFSNNFKRSVITGIGAKNRVSNKIIDLMPEHSIYIEPFGNTASILLQKPRVKKEIFNDINNEVTNFFLVLRENPIGLYNACSTLPYSEEVYRKMRNSPIPNDPLEAAVRFFYLNRGSYLGSAGTSFRVNSNSRNFSKLYYAECERFYAVSNRFQGVEITNRDYRKIINRYKDEENALFLCDPPYYGCVNYYKTDFNLKDHSKLAHLLAEIKGKAMVCHSKEYQIHKLYMGLNFKFERIEHKYASRKAKENEDGIKVKRDSPLYIYMNF